MIVSENSDIFPASKATTLETNRSSVNSRPRPASAAAGTGATGGTIDEPMSHSIPLRRSRRQALQHAPSISENLSLSSVEIMHDSQLVASSSKTLVAHDSIHVHDHSKVTTSFNQDASHLFLKSSTSSSTDIKLAPKQSESHFEPNKSPVSTDDVDKEMVQDMPIFTINRGETNDRNMLKNDVPLDFSKDELDRKLTIFPEKSDSIFSASRISALGVKSKPINTTNDFAIASSKHSHDDNAVLAEVVPPSNDDDNRVLVNVTISTGKTRPLYVLSISVPTNDSSGRMPDVKLTPVDAQHELYAPSESLKIADYASDAAYKETTTVKPLDTSTSTTTTIVSADNVWGGQCVCSCPVCLDNENDNITDSFFDDDEDDFFEEDEAIKKAKSNIEAILRLSTTRLNLTDLTTTEANLVSLFGDDDSVSESVPYSSSEASSLSTDETTTESSDSTETLCPTMTTPLPQPPTILILEGKIDFLRPFVWSLY